VVLRPSAKSADHFQEIVASNLCVLGALCGDPAQNAGLVFDRQKGPENRHGGLSMPSRCVVILLDGLGDRSFATLGNMTPLQAAHTPNLDALARRGANGLFHAEQVGMAFSSQDAHFSLFGYGWHERPRRAILEAWGSGLEVGPQDVAVLARLISARDDDGVLTIVDRRPKATAEEMATIMAEVDTYRTGDISFRFTQINQLEGILVIKGDVSPRITDTDPLCNGLPAAELRPLHSDVHDPIAQKTAQALKEYLTWIYGALTDHPVNRARIARGDLPLNAFITHLSDRPRPVVPFEQRWGFKGMFISSKLVGWGVSAALGMNTCKVKSSPDPARDLRERIAIAADNLSNYDYIHVHTMAPDEAAHTKDPVAKKQVIEALDRAIGAAIPPIAENPEVLLVVTSDHSTPSSGPLIHSGEAVPLTMVGEGVRVDRVDELNEIACARGALGTIRGGEFMLLVLNALDRCKLRGIMHTAEDRHFWPGHYEPFRIRP